MPTVWIPSLLRDLTRGQTTVAVPGTTVRRVIENLEAAHPGIKERLCDADRLKPTVAVAVDGVVSRLGMLQPVDERSEVHFLPAVGGGERPTPFLPPGEPGLGEEAALGALG